MDLFSVGVVDVRLVEVGAGVEVLVVVIPEGRTVDLVGAGLGGDRDRGAAGHALLGVKRRRRDVDGLDGFDWRIVQRVVRQPDVNVGGAVTRVLLLLRLVPLTLVVSERCGEAPIEFWNAAGVAPGHQVDHALIVAVGRQREFHYGLGTDLGASVGAVGLQGGGQRTR